MTTSVVVVSLEPGDWLRDCLDSVSSQSDEVILVDNGSANARASDIGTAAGVQVIRSERNLGYAGGVNLGLSRVRGDLVALLNDDAVAGANWLAAAATALVDPDVAAVVPKVLRSGWYREVVFDDVHEAPGDHRQLGRMIRSVTSAGSEVLDQLLGAGVHGLESPPVEPGQRWRWTKPRTPFYVPIENVDDHVAIDGGVVGAGRVCRLLNKAGGYLLEDGVFGDRGDESPDDGRWDEPFEPFFGSGTALAARAETIRRVGNLAEPFFAYYEDGDWCWRARLAGMRILYDPSSVVEHRHSATAAGRLGAQVSRLAVRNRLLTLVRNAPLSVVRRNLARAFRDTEPGAARRDLLTKLGWALQSRRSLRKAWVVEPQKIWDSWVGVGSEWDRSAVADHG